MRKILWITQEDIKRRILLNGPIKSDEDYLYCVHDKRLIEGADIVLAHNLSGTITIVKSKFEEFHKHISNFEELWSFLRYGTSNFDEIERQEEALEEKE